MLVRDCRQLWFTSSGALVIPTSRKTKKNTIQNRISERITFNLAVFTELLLPGQG